MRAVEVPYVAVNPRANGDVGRFITAETDLHHAQIGRVGTQKARGCERESLPARRENSFTFEHRVGELQRLLVMDYLATQRGEFNPIE